MKHFTLTPNDKLYIYSLNKSFLKRMKTWCIPDFQRSVQAPVVNQMIADQEDHMLHHGYMDIGGMFVVAMFNKKEYLIDGQHRMKMLEHFFEQGKETDETKVLVKVTTIFKQEDLLHLFQFVNSNHPVEVCQRSNCFAQVKHVQDLLQEKFKSRLSASENHQPQTIHALKFCNFLTSYHLLSEQWSRQQVEHFLDQLNIFFKEHMNDYHLSQRHIAACESNTFYLGLYSRLDDEQTQTLISSTMIQADSALRRSPM